MNEDVYQFNVDLFEKLNEIREFHIVPRSEAMVVELYKLLASC